MLLKSLIFFHFKTEKSFFFKYIYTTEEFLDFRKKSFDFERFLFFFNYILLLDSSPSRMGDEPSLFKGVDFSFSIDQSI